MFQVKWDNVVSAPFCVSNGVWQGGILSPILFNVYIDELSDQLNRLKTVLWATLLVIILCMQMTWFCSFHIVLGCSRC